MHRYMHIYFTDDCSHRWSFSQGSREPRDTRLSVAPTFSPQIKTRRSWNSLQRPISGLLHSVRNQYEAMKPAGAAGGDQYVKIQSYLTSWHWTAAAGGRLSSGWWNQNKTEETDFAAGMICFHVNNEKTLTYLLCGILLVFICGDLNDGNFLILNILCSG